MDISVSSANHTSLKINIEDEQVHVLIFKTNIHSTKDVKIVSPKLNELSFIISWNIDLDDCDKVLRVESQNNDNQSIISVIQNAGYHCEELAD